MTALLTTQYLEEADQLADKIAMLHHGRIVAEGTADQLKSSLGGEVVRLQFGDRAGYRHALGLVTAIRADERLFLALTTPHALNKRDIMEKESTR